MSKKILFFVILLPLILMLMFFAATYYFNRGVILHFYYSSISKAYFPEVIKVEIDDNNSNHAPPEEIQGKFLEYPGSKITRYAYSKEYPYIVSVDMETEDSFQDVFNWYNENLEKSGWKKGLNKPNLFSASGDFSYFINYSLDLSTNILILKKGTGKGSTINFSSRDRFYQPLISADDVVTLNQ